MSRLRQRSTHSHSFRGKHEDKHLKTSREGKSSPPPLRFQISSLLSLFNEMEVEGVVDRGRLVRIMQTIGMQQQSQLLTHEHYSFDGWLSALGQIQSPSQPSSYVLAFLSLLANYRDKCLEGGDEALPQATAVHERIHKIRQAQMARQKHRIRRQHRSIYEEMQRSQQEQFRRFEEEWQGYLNQFRTQTSKRLSEQRRERKQKWQEEQSKWMNRTGKGQANSARLRQLVYRKDQLVRQKELGKAVEVARLVRDEQERLRQQKEQARQSLLQKRLKRINESAGREIKGVERSLEANLQRLVKKKQEGAHIMKIRMRKLREEATRKLTHHETTQLSELRQSLNWAAGSAR